MAVKKSGLGRNLNILLGSQATKKEEKASQASITWLSLDLLKPGQYQPRKNISHQSIEELSLSIKQQGLLQPIVVRRLTPDSYEIIAGERRYRAAKNAGLTEVPTIIHHVDDKTTLAMALIENIQREDLNPMEEARGLARLVNEFDLTHQQASEVVGKSRSTISNLLRLVNLNPKVAMMLEKNQIEMGHARALLSLDGDRQMEVATTIVKEGLTVRLAEQLIQNLLNEKPKKANAMPQSSEEAKTRALMLSRCLGEKVTIQPSRQGKFKVTIQYSNLDKLDELINKLA